MTDSKPAPTFRRAAPPPAKAPASRASMPAGQSNTAAIGPNGTLRLNKRMAELGQAEDGHEPAITLVQPQNRWAEDNARFFFHPSQLKSLVPAAAGH